MTVPAEALLVTVAPTGAETTKADCPQLPTTLEELVTTARECEAAGAAMIHVHIRDDDHRPSLDLTRLTDTVQALHEATDLVVQLSTGGSVHDALDDRLKVLDAAPDSCSLTMGTTNFGDDVFSNPWPFVCELYQLSQERQVVPEFELFDLGQVDSPTPAARPLRPAPRRQGALRLRDGRPRRHARHRRRPGRRRRRPPARDHLVGRHRHRPQHPRRRARRPVEGRPPPRRHGGRADDQPRRPGGVQPAAGRARGRARRRSPSAVR